MDVIKHYILVLDACHFDKLGLKEFLQNLEAETQICLIFLNWNKQEVLNNFHTKWFNLKALVTELDELSPLQEKCLETGKITLCDVLHQVADDLPVAGSLVDIIIDLSTVEDIDGSFLCLLHGVLKRYQLWLSSNISILCCEPKANSYKNKDILLEVLAVNPVPHISCVPIKQHSKWRGSLVFSDTQNGKDKFFPGFLLETTIKSSRIKIDVNEENSDENSQSCSTYEKVSSNYKLGNLMTILDLVDINTIPLFLIKPKLYKLSLQNLNSSSQNILEYFSTLNKTAMIVSVPSYQSESLIPSFKSMELGSSAWKECVLADLVQDAVPQYNHHNDAIDVVHMVLMHKDFSSSIGDIPDVSSCSLQVYLLRSPSELSGQVMDLMHLTPHLYLAEQDPFEPLLPDLPLITGKMLYKIHTQLTKTQFAALKYYFESNSSSKSISSENLFEFLSKIQEKFIETLKVKIPTLSATAPLKRKLQTCSFGELDSEPLSWPERIYISQLESVKKAICRFQSFDSLSLSSPLIIPSEETTPTCIDEILGHFLPNGKASCPSLSPLISQHHLRSYVYPSVEEEFETSRLDWPFCREARFPDVCYNKDGNSEKIQLRLNKIRDKFVCSDTMTTCSIQGSVNSFSHSSLNIVAPLNIHRNNRDSLALRKKSEMSKLSSRSVSDSKEIKNTELQFGFGWGSSRKRLGNQLQTVLDESVSKTRKTENAVLPRSSDDVKLKEKERKMSRSERHRKKLEEIVQSVLKQEGVDETSDIFTRCAQRLFKVTKLYVMDLPNSYNLSQDMKRIAEGQVKHVVELESCCQKSLKKRKLVCR